MNTIEQQLWDYIDGNLNEIQRKNIEEKIKTDAAVKLQYEELLNLNAAFSEMEIDEPSMSFTRNVMESVALEPAPISLKTKVDTRIIFSIGSFFVLSILALLGYIFYNSTFTMPDFGKYFTSNFSLDKYITPTAMYVFIGFDIIIGLIFMDYFLRRKLNQRD
ncbi:anti-sigma factor family protein [Pedobacter jamesrossensis]|uniref:Anti-sigma factor family protein n=1 Tax=Pedobacter jamesrossensis TaxID=1908238 RepID=A0ABV8NQ96_9SPHI